MPELDRLGLLDQLPQDRPVAGSCIRIQATGSFDLVTIVFELEDTPVIDAPNPEPVLVDQSLLHAAQRIRSLTDIATDREINRQKELLVDGITVEVIVQESTGESAV